MPKFGSRSQYDLVVIGSGYWGAGIAYEARRKGWLVLCIDDRDEKAGSRNASGVCDPKAYQSSVFKKYLPPGWGKAELQDSFSWLIDRGGQLQDEWFMNRWAGTLPRSSHSCIYLDSNSLITGLNGVGLRGKVSRIELGRGTIEVITSDRIVSAKRVVIAAGYRTDQVLESAGLSPVGVGELPGRGLVGSGRPEAEIPLSVMIRPYCKHTVRSWGRNLYRIGDTAEKVPRPKSLDDLRAVAHSVLTGFRETEIVFGYRPVADRFLVEKLKPNLVVATGGHRVGLGLTGLVAARTLEILD